MADKVKITIDGVVHEVEAGANVLQAILDEGKTIPHFCYHEALGAVGSCRLCACSIAPGEDKPARMEMSCMVRASEGMVVQINDDMSTKFRKQVIEDLMLNHPHDCPVCDEGGECSLQDMTVLTQHQHRRNRFPKKTWKNQYLGPLIHQEMNRCITCYRCVRYYRDYALGEDFGVYGSRSRVFFGRVEDGILESEFSGNLIDVCPTGVFTNKQFRDNYARPWDLQTARSVCASCSIGCNVLPGYRNNTLRRIKPASQENVNKFFMCDRGRYGGDFVNDAARLNTALFYGAEQTVNETILSVAEKLKSISKTHGAQSVAGIGSTRASMETNAALNLLLKGLGSNRFVTFETNTERNTIKRAASITTGGEVTVPSIPDMESADFVLVLGGDLTAEAAGMDLSVRQAIRNGAKLFVVSPRAGSIDKFATAVWRTVPGEEANIASFIASVPAGSKVEDDNFVQQVGVELQNAKKPIVLCSASHNDINLVEMAYSLAKSSTAYSGRTCKLAYFYPAANSVGAGLLRSDENPENLWADIYSGKIKALVVVENELTNAIKNQPGLEKALASIELIVTIDSLETPISKASHAIIPCVSYYQSFGTMINYEGRGQRFDGMQFAVPVNLAASEILVNLIQESGVEESIGGTEFNDIYDVSRESSKGLDSLKVGDGGFIVQSSPKLPPTLKATSISADDDNKLTLWNVIHTFGSDFLSSFSQSILELAPKPYVEMNSEDAAKRGFTEGQNIDLTEELGVSGPLKFNNDLARGTVAVPVLIKPELSGIAVSGKEA